MELSREFLVALKLADRPQWRLAREAGIAPITLSRLVTGYSPVRHMDARIVAVGRVLDLSPAACFAAETVTESNEQAAVA